MPNQENDKIGPIELGQGFNPFSNQPGRLAVINSNTITDRKQFNMQVMVAVDNTLEQLYRQIALTTNLSTPSSVVSGKTTLHRESSHQREIIELAVFAYTVTSKRYLESRYLPEPSSIPAPTTSSASTWVDDWYNACGTKFVRGIDYGRAMLAVFHIEVSHRKNSHTVKTELEAQLGNTEGHISLQHIAAKLAKFNIVKIYLEGWGITIPPAYADISHTDVPTILNELASLINHADGDAPLTLHFAPYTVLFTENLALMREYYSQYIQPLETLFKAFNHLHKKIHTALNFYFTFDETNPYPGKFNDPHHLALCQQKTSLEKLALALTQTQQALAHAPSLTTLSLDRFRTQLARYSKKFAELEKTLPQHSQYTLVANVDLALRPWEKVGQGWRKRISKRFSLTLPPNTDYILLTIAPRRTETAASPAEDTTTSITTSHDDSVMPAAAPSGAENASHDTSTDSDSELPSPSPLVAAALPHPTYLDKQGDSKPLSLVLKSKGALPPSRIIAPLFIDGGTTLIHRSRLKKFTSFCIATASNPQLQEGVCPMQLAIHGATARKTPREEDTERWNTFFPPSPDAFPKGRIKQPFAGKKTDRSNETAAADTSTPSPGAASSST